MKLTSHSVAETNKLAAGLARKVMKIGPQKYATVVALEGELGAGKTVFVKAFARAFGIKSRITSPTFVLMKRYTLTAKRHMLLFHIDAYRLRDYRDLLSLGIKEAITDPANIILIEWSERVKPILPKKCTKVHIDHVDNSRRKISISEH